MKDIALKSIVDSADSRNLSGDIIDAGDVVDFGEVNISVDPEDLGTILTGAPVSQRIGKLAKLTPKRALADPQTIAAVNAAQKAGAAAGVDAMNRASFPLCLIENGSVHQSPVASKAAGRYLQDSCIRSQIYAPNYTLVKSAMGAGVGSDTVIEFAGGTLNTVGATANISAEAVVDAADGPATASYLAATPLIIITFTSSQLNAAPDQRLKVWIEGKGEFGVQLSKEAFTVSRSNGNTSTKLMLLPFTKIGDVTIPAPAFIGKMYNFLMNLKVHVSGADATMQITVEIPGRDSRDMERFLQAWSLSPKK